MLIKELDNVIRELPEVIEHSFVDRVNFNGALKNKKMLLAKKDGRTQWQQEQQDKDTGL